MIFKNIKELKEIIVKKDKNPIITQNINGNIIINPPIPKRSGYDIVEKVNELYRKWLFKSL